MVKTSFSNLLEAIGQTEAHTDPFELHGTLCGILCVRQRQTADTWIGEFAPKASHEERKKLIALFELTQQQLESPDLDFRLLLPGDEQPLSKRTQALAGWARGFLYGLGVGGLGKDVPLDDDAQEFLGDMAEIAKAEHYSDNDSHQHEVAYYEIIEYLRMGVLLIYESLHPTHGDFFSHNKP